MNVPVPSPAQAKLNEISKSENEISHVEFASRVLANRRTAMGLSVKQITEMAAAILVLDHNLDEANQRLITMLAEAITTKRVTKQSPQPEPPKPKTVAKRELVQVVVNPGLNNEINEAIKSLVAAHKDLEEAVYSPGENLARQKFEKAGIAVAQLCSPKKRNRQ